MLPVLSVYNSLEAYFSIFHPLMFHEIWANICKDVETTKNVWEALIHNHVAHNWGCSILFCETVVSHGSLRFKDLDLVALSIPIANSQTTMKVFGIVENVELRTITPDKPLDQRLLKAHKRIGSPDYRITFYLRVKQSNIPLKLNSIFTVSSVTALRTVYKQFVLNAELDSSPLGEVILNPGGLSEAFRLDVVDVEGNEKLNPIQNKAVDSITRTILNTCDDEPKVALLQGPPGVCLTLEIV